MRLWPFKRKDPEEPEPLPEGVTFPATPYAGLLMDLIELGLTAPQVVYVVHRIEIERAKAKVELNLSATKVDKPVLPKPRPVNKPVKRSGANNRRAYMREYMRKRRASPRLVSRDGVLTDGGD